MGVATPGQDQELLRNRRLHPGLIDGQLAVVIPAQQGRQGRRADGTVHTGDARLTIHQRNQTAELAGNALGGRCVVGVGVAGRRARG